jgi:hypothetical protein
MTIVAASVPQVDVPRFLLDTNIYLELADGPLSAHESRLVAVAAHRTPPLFWACEIVFDELVYRIRADDHLPAEGARLPSLRHPGRRE